MDSKRLKARFCFLEPKTIMAIVVSLIMLTVGVIAVGQITSTQDDAGYSATYHNTFTVTDPTSNQNLNTGEDGLTGITITQTLSDGTTQTINATDYTYTGTTITVDSSALYG